MGCFESSNTGQSAVYQGNQQHGLSQDLNQAVFLATEDQGAAGLQKKVQLSLSAKGLPNLDTLSKSDPMVVLLVERKGQWVEFGRTEIIRDNLNPQWVRSFDLTYKFEERQRLRFQVYDVDNFEANVALSAHDYIGTVEVLLHQVVGAVNQRLHKPIKNDKKSRKNGELIISLNTQDTESKELIKFQLTGKNLYNTNKIFLALYRENPGGHRVPVYRSETQSNKLEWKQIQILSTTLAIDGNKELPFWIQAYQFKSNGNHKKLGESSISITQLLERSEAKQDIVLRNQKNEILGLLVIKRMQIEERFSFLQYIYGGCKMHLIVAVDYTLSNGDPKNPSSLHFFDPSRNEYIQAIASVGEILQCYDSEKNIAAYGFGAQIPPIANRASHCFALNGNIFNPKLQGVANIIECYKNTLNNVKLYGPTHFSEVLAMAVDQAAHHNVSQYNQHYYTLLILTDGVINDLEQTIDQIVRGSGLPLSIIIVGVGKEDFSSMEVLDADDHPLYSKTLQKQMERDIVQFVPFRQFKNDPYRLAQETLNEVPRQFISYMSQKGIQPNLQGVAKYHAGPLGGMAEPDFFMSRRERMIQQMIQLGYSQNDILNLVEYGVPEEQVNFMVEIIQQQYVNPLLYKNQIIDAGVGFQSMMSIQSGPVGAAPFVPPSGRY